MIHDYRGDSRFNIELSREMFSELEEGKGKEEVQELANILAIMVVALSDKSFEEEYRGDLRKDYSRAFLELNAKIDFEAKVIVDKITSDKEEFDSIEIAIAVKNVSNMSSFVGSVEDLVSEMFEKGLYDKIHE